MRPLRISAISFLNTAPLMWDFQFGEVLRNFEISYTVPSLCAQALQAGQADIGIIPAITYAEIPDLAIIPDVAIASRGPVRSILLMSKVPIEQIQTVATDTSSRTSVVLCQLLLRRFLGTRPSFSAMAPELGTMLASHDAALLIGDAALLAEHSAPYDYDLAEMWVRFTGKPFVFAFWALRREALKASPGLDLVGIFQRSRDHGLQPSALEVLSAEWSKKVGMSGEEVRAYLTQNIHYHLDRACLDGLRTFLTLAADEGLSAPAPDLAFVPSTQLIPR
jgi:chorismate dehydratase